MEALALVFSLEVGIFLGGLILIVVYQTLTGKINVDGLLVDSETGEVSPARIQLLVFTLAGALYYAYRAATAPEGLPEIGQELLLLLGGSHAVYLGNQAFPRRGG
jgi:hypothetical protein